MALDKTTVDFCKNTLEGYFCVAKPISNPGMTAELGRALGTTGFLFTFAGLFAGATLKLTTDFQYFTDQFYILSSVPTLTQAGSAAYHLYHYFRGKKFEDIDWDGESEEDE